MISSPQVTHVVRNAGDAGEARRRAVELAGDLGMNETERGRVALIATEATTNIAKHASSGELLVRAVDSRGQRGIEMIALDRGPGMSDVGRCLQDGYSTAGSPGTGLGAITRLATEFDIHSVAGTGTAVLARVLGHGTTTVSADLDFEIGAVCLPLPGEHICGDAWSSASSADRIVLLVADGLGHGPLAATAAEQATRTLAAHPQDGPEELLNRVHKALRGTRGAAVAIAELRPKDEQLRFVGIGNIAAAVLSGKDSRSLVSLNGIVGEHMRKVQVFDYPFRRDSRLIMHSDGLTGRWNVGTYSGLLGRDPSLVAAVLYRDHRRERDDVTVVVAREREVRT